MALDLDAVARALTAVVADAQLRLNGLQITANDYLPEAIDPPCFVVAEFTSPLHKDFSGEQEVTFTCRLFTSRGDAPEGQRLVRQAASGAGGGSIPVALEAARTANGGTSLGGTVDDFLVQTIRGPRLYEVGGVNYYGLEYTIFAMG